MTTRTQERMPARLANDEGRTVVTSVTDSNEMGYEIAQMSLAFGAVFLAYKCFNHEASRERAHRLVLAR